LSRRKCFECVCPYGRVITLYTDRYNDHILMEHPELKRDYDFPALQIQHAIENVKRVRPSYRRTILYEGPPVQANPPAGIQRIWVVIAPEKNDDGWWVVTAYGELFLE
jgi:hypothetical protein